MGLSTRARLLHKCRENNTICVLTASVSSPGFPEPETRGFWVFSTTRNQGFIQLPSPGIKKNLELLLRSNISDSDNTKVADWRG